MIRFLSVFNTCLLVLVLVAAGTAAAKDRPKLIVGGDHDCPPYEFLENGIPTGFDIDLMRAVAEVMGFDLEIRLGPWSKARHDLEQGKIEALAGMYYSPERRMLVDFSVPHTMVSSGIFVRKDSPIRSFEDIRGKEIIVQESDVIHDFLKRHSLTTRIVAVTDAEEGNTGLPI
jgi:ABC-type amino acid transport substrate-binding protein